MSSLHLRANNQDDAIRVHIERTAPPDDTWCSVEWQDRHAEIEFGRIGAGEGWFRWNGETVPYFASRTGDTVHVWVRGEVHTFTLVNSSAQRSSGSGPRGVHETVTAPMPGTVLRVEVAEGDTFERHQPLVILESMKMEMTLTLPHGGRIEKITCQVGELVEMNAVLAVLAEPGDA